MTPMDWVALASLVTAGTVGARWWSGRVDTLGRTRRFPWVAVGLLIVTSLGMAVPGAQRRSEEARLSAVASQVASQSVRVHCQTFGEAFVDAGSELGWVAWRPDGTASPETLIKRSPCRDLRDYLGSDQANPTLAQVVAVHVLTHESMHMSGILEEAMAECAAVQRDALTATLLGASDSEAQDLARRYWTTVYPDMPDAYRTPDCRAGGPLDENLASPPWAATG
ncbi:MAG: hypothetical protein WAN48_12440 [Actinomycetes bacterium]